jgi:DNA-binding winged helix-turn-helix (wHTH) protein
MAFLVVEKGGRQDIGRRFAVEEDAVLIGRATPKSNPDIKVHDDYVSRQHAEISYHQNCFMIRDLESTNGTEVDGRRIEPGNLHPLRHNSIIGLGISSEGARVLLRFKESPTTSTVRIEEIKINEISPVKWLKMDETRREVWVDEELLALSRKEYDLVLFLHSRAGKVCSRDELIAEVWPEVADPGGVSDAAIDQLIHRLRVKIEPDPSRPRRLISRKGFGYMLV